MDHHTPHTMVQVTEYRSGEPHQRPLYHCGLAGCRDEQGEAEAMKTHLLTARHKRVRLSEVLKVHASKHFESVKGGCTILYTFYKTHQF